MSYALVPGGRGYCVMVSGEDLTLREMLIAMDGRLALIQKDNEIAKRDLGAIRDRTHELANALQANYTELSNRVHAVELSLVGDRKHAEGERKGFDKAVKAVYALATICGLSGLAAAAKVLIGS